MSKHIFERLHVLSGVSDKVVFTETRNVNLSVPLIIAFEQLLVNLVRFIYLVLGFLPDRPYSCNSVTDPFHVTQRFGFCLNDGFHFPFCMENAHHTLEGGFFPADDLFPADFKDLLNFFGREFLSTPVIE